MAPKASSKARLLASSNQSAAGRGQKSAGRRTRPKAAASKAAPKAAADASSHDEVSVVLPKKEGERRARRIAVRVPKSVFPRLSSSPADKGKALSRALADVWADLGDDILPERNNATGIALYILLTHGYLSKDEHAQILEEMGVGPQDGKAADTGAAEHADHDEHSDDDDHDDDHDDDDEDDFEDVAADESQDHADDHDDDDDPLKVVLYSIVDPKYSAKQTNEALATYIGELHEDDLDNLEEFLEVCIDWVSSTAAEAKGSDVARDNPWLYEMFSECMRVVPAATRRRLPQRFEDAASIVHAALGDESDASDASESDDADAQEDFEEFAEDDVDGDGDGDDVDMW